MISVVIVIPNITNRLRLFEVFNSFCKILRLRFTFSCFFSSLFPDFMKHKKIVDKMINTIDRMIGKKRLNCSIAGVIIVITATARYWMKLLFSRYSR